MVNRVAGKYNELLTVPMFPNMMALADYGHYFTATNATPGTPVNFVVSAAYSATVALLTMRNGQAVQSTTGYAAALPTLAHKRIMLHYIRLIQGATVPASGAAGQYAITLDNTLRGSAGTVLTPNGANLDNAPASIADLRFAPTVAAAGTNAYVAGRGVMRSAIPVVNDEYLWTFGGVDAADPMDISGTTAKRLVMPCAPVILGPDGNQTMLLHVWFPSNATTPGSFEFEVGWLEY